jgi:hypothetical protein
MDSHYFYEYEILCEMLHNKFTLLYNLARLQSVEFFLRKSIVEIIP